MRNTFKYTLTFEDYLSFEKLKVKMRRGNLFIGVLLVVVSSFILYNTIKNGYVGQMYYFYYGIFSAIAIIMALYNNMIAPKRSVKKYINRDSSYLGENQITIDSDAVEIKTIPAEKQAGTVCIYPYNVMAIIYENQDYFYFSVGSEVKILPKRVIPNEMKEDVFKSIESNSNCVLIK